MTSRKWMLTAVVAITSVFFLLGMQYNSIVHRGIEITGNPSWASGRFWHSSYSRLYPASEESRGLVDKSSITKD